MQFYQEITLIEQAEISPYFIWSRVYGQIHIGLVDNKNPEGNIPFGVSFPQYYYDEQNQKGHIGKKLRVFATTEADLKRLDLPTWLSRLSDYVHITSIRAVPDKVDGYSIYQRKRVKGASRIEKEMQEKAQIWSEKSGKALAACLAELEKTKPEALCYLPFLWLDSQETKKRRPEASNRFQLFIKRNQSDAPQKGLFDSYGLSTKESISTVPDFK